MIDFFYNTRLTVLSGNNVGRVGNGLELGQK